MNFLSNALSLLLANSIPYTIQDKIVEPTGNSDLIIWTVYDGINPKNDTPVTIFEFNLKDPKTAIYVELARNCYKKLKLIKHPLVISTVDFIENESFLYIVTERVVPLLTYLVNYQPISPDVRVYGISKIVSALEFINSKANCVHGNLNWYSVFVNNQGEWKLFGFEVLTNLTSDADQPIYRNSRYLSSFSKGIPPEVSANGAQAIQPAPKLLDSYKLGIFIYQLFATKDFNIPNAVEPDKLPTKLTSFVDSSHIPRQLATPVMRLLSGKRITTEKFAQESQHFFKSNPLVEFSSLLEEIKFADDQSKLSFFKHELGQYVEGNFPPGFLDNKLLPDIVEQFHQLAKSRSAPSTTPEELAGRHEAVSIILSHLLTLGQNLNDDLFDKLIAPAIFVAFTLPDRSVRLSLLKNLSSYGTKLEVVDVQNKVFPHLITGFQDSNFLIRETTLTSMTMIIDKVSIKQINNELLKVLAKLQMDPKPSIRTNTLILIIRIAKSIYATSRNNVMITALSKALRDSFTPCKMAALSGFENLMDTFSLEEKCTKVLGHLAVSLMDPKSHKVRKEAKRILQKYLDAIEQNGATLPEDEEDEDAEEKEFIAHVTEASGTASKATSESGVSFGWSMVNKLVSSEPSAVSGEIDPALNRSTPDLTKNNMPAIPQDWNDDIVDEWGNEDDVEIEASIPEPPKPKAKPVVNKRSAIKKKEPVQPRSNGLKLGHSQKIPGSTLKLDLHDDEEDEWGSSW